MKKLLSIIAAVGLTATASTAVVACGTQEQKLYDKIDWTNKDSVVFVLADGTEITLGDLISTDKIDENLFNTLDRKITEKNAEDTFKKTIIPSLFLEDKNLNNNIRYNGQNENNIYSNEIKEMILATAEMDLYNEYLDGLSSSSKKPLDEKKLYRLNPISFNGKDANLINSFDSEYSLWFKRGDDYRRWTTSRELINTENSDNIIKNRVDFLPTQNELTENIFYLVKSDFDIQDVTKDEQLIVKDLNDVKKISSSNEKEESKTEIVEKDMDGKKALTYRFQDYLQQLTGTTSSKKIDIMAMQYLKNKLYDIKKYSINDKDKSVENATKNALYLNTNSILASQLQTWDWDNTNGGISTDYKMAWTFEYDETKEKDVESALAELLNNKIIDDTFAKIDVTKGNNNSVSEIFKVLNEATADSSSSDELSNVDNNKSENPADPFFNHKGFQGIIKNGESIAGGNITIKEEAAKDKIQKVDSLGVLVNKLKVTNKDYSFSFNGTTRDKKEIVIVMPVYLLDILRDGKLPTNEKRNDTLEVAKNDLTNIVKNQWVELLPQNKEADWKNNQEVSGTLVENIKDESIPENGKIGIKKSNYGSNDFKTYIYITDGIESGSSIKIGDTNVNFIYDDSKINPTSYGLNGVYKSKNSDRSDVSELYNGQEVTYKINLGYNDSNKDSYEETWINENGDKNVSDIANLTSVKKDELLNTLIYDVSKNNAKASEEAKKEIYKKYISLDDIYYRPLYDKLKPYIEEDEDEDETD